MTALPEHIINKIMLYNIHPLAELFKKEFSKHIEIMRQEQDKRGRPSFYVIWYDLRLFSSDDDCSDECCCLVCIQNDDSGSEDDDFRVRRVCQRTTDKLRRRLVFELFDQSCVGFFVR